MTVTAHAGHWALQLVYVFPLVLVLGFIVLDKVRSRKDDDEPSDPD